MKRVRRHEMSRIIITFILIAVCFGQIHCSASNGIEYFPDIQSPSSLFSDSNVSQIIQQKRGRDGNLETDGYAHLQIAGVDIGLCGLNCGHSFEESVSAETFLWGALSEYWEYSDFTDIEDILWRDSCVTLINSTLYTGGIDHENNDYLDEYYRFEIANNMGDNWIVYDVLLHLFSSYDETAGEWTSGGEGVIIGNRDISNGEIPKGKASYIGMWILDAAESDGVSYTAEDLENMGVYMYFNVEMGGACSLNNSGYTDYGEWEYRYSEDSAYVLFYDNEEKTKLSMTSDGRLVCQVTNDGCQEVMYFSHTDEKVAMAQIDGCDVFSLAIEQLGYIPTTARELFLDTYICIVDDVDSYWAIVYRDCNAAYSLISSESISEYLECYTFEIEIDDPFMMSRYNVCVYIGDDYHVNELSILSNETSYKIKDITWDSSEVDYQCLKTVVKPDGVPAITSVIYSNSSGKDYWYTIDQKQVVSTEDGYYYDINREPTLRMYNDGRIYYWGSNYYPRGYEKAVNTIELTSGNAIGNTSSNTFNRSSVAYEDGVMICKDGGAVVRFTENGERYTLHPESLYVNYSSLNLVDGVLYYCQDHEYVIAETLNGDSLWLEYGDCIIADTDFAYFIDYNEGLYRRNLATGKVETIMDAYGLDGLSCDDSHIYWSKDGKLFAASRENSLDYHEILADTYVAYYIAEANSLNGSSDCSTLIYATYCDDRDDMQIRAALIDWSNNASVTDLGFIGYNSDFYGWFEEDGWKRPYIAYSNGWIYYYYDAEIVCRRNLQGTVIDEFLGYNPWGKCAPLYIFNNRLFLHTLEFSNLE